MPNVIKTATFVALACLGLAGCNTPNEPGRAPITNSMQPVTPPSNSGISIPGSTAPMQSGNSMQAPTGGPGLTVQPSNASPTGANLPGSQPTSGGAAYTRPPLSQ